MSSARTPLRLAFFGTPAFAVPTLDRLLAGPDEVVAVVSQPDRERGRGRRRSRAPVAERAAAEGIPLLQPERVGTPESALALAAHAPDLGVVVAFGQFLPKRVRELPRLHYLINGHASLLPRHRGAAPIAHAVLAGDPETGISVMRVEREMDAGAVCLVERTPIGPEETTGELEARLATLAAEAIAEAVEQIAADTVHWSEQDAELATLAPKLEREHGRLDFSADAATLARRIRAFNPRPGAFADWEGEPLRILRASAVGAPAGSSDRPGTLRHAEDGTVCVATGDGWLVLRELQRPGGRPLATAEFLRGRALPDGARLGAAS